MMQSSENIDDGSTGSFDIHGLQCVLCSNIRQFNWTSPTQLQKTTISCIVSGNDLLAIGGSGYEREAACVISAIIHTLTSENNVTHQNKELSVIIRPTIDLVLLYLWES